MTEKDGEIATHIYKPLFFSWDNIQTSKENTKGNKIRKHSIDFAKRVIATRLYTFVHLLLYSSLRNTLLTLPFPLINQPLIT